MENHLIKEIEKSVVTLTLNEKGNFLTPVLQCSAFLNYLVFLPVGLVLIYYLKIINCISGYWVFLRFTSTFH